MYQVLSRTGHKCRPGDARSGEQKRIYLTYGENSGTQAVMQKRITGYGRENQGKNAGMEHKVKKCRTWYELQV